MLTGSDGHPWRRAAGVFAPQVLTCGELHLHLTACVIVGESISQRLVGG